MTSPVEPGWVFAGENNRRGILARLLNCQCRLLFRRELATLVRSKEVVGALIGLIAVPFGLIYAISLFSTLDLARTSLPVISKIFTSSFSALDEKKIQNLKLDLRAVRKTLYQQFGDFASGKDYY